MDSLISLSRQDIDQMDKVPRLKLINCLSGFKSANLIGTVNKNNIENLAVFSSVIHLGSNPPLMGCILRPHSVPRHTYENIKKTGWYTVNHVNRDIYKKAHQTSGKYNEELSEFEMVDLNSWYSDHCNAPYVKEARIKIGLQPVEEHVIEANNTIMVVGAIKEVWIPKKTLEDDGKLNIEKAGTVTISGLDGYHATSQLDSLGYVRVDEKLQRDS